MSGTSTQITGIINYFKSRGKVVRDARGTEMDLLFHAEVFKKYNKDFISLKEFLDSKKFTEKDKSKLIFEIYSLLSGYKKDRGLMVGSFKKNKVTTYINPDSADVWVLEEPTKRGAGQVNRVIEQNRSVYDFEETIDGNSAALCHQAYRIDEFYRIRKILRESNKIIIRSRSEESACYQIYDKIENPKGINLRQYLSLPGNRLAFKYPPTHLFVVCGPENWDKKEYQKFKASRAKGRVLDDYESDEGYQLFVNRRYASGWLEELYRNACKENNFGTPKIYRFDIYASKECIMLDMKNKLDKIIK